jgi:diadenosine tetraphosphate (Ap4A) HIT family hydrolase
MTNLLRTKSGADTYTAYRNAGGLENDGCVLCSASSLQEFTHWRIVTNKFPYDLIAREHHMLIPKRHVTEHDLTNEEKTEFETIKQHHLGKYDYFIETNQHMKSIPAHFHLHIIVGRPQ